MRPWLLIPLLLLLTLIGAGCDPPPPPPPDPALVQLYCDLALAAGVSGPAAPDSVRAALFQRYGTSPEAFHAALTVYREDPRGWVLFFQAVADTLEARVRDLGPAQIEPPARTSRPPG